MCPSWVAGVSRSFPTPRLRHRAMPWRSSRRQSGDRPRGSRCVRSTPMGTCAKPGKRESFSSAAHSASPVTSTRRLNDAAIDADRWFHTGDLGTIDAAGNVRITGRLKDIIIRNAENISAVEVEDLLFRHPAVADAAVVGAPGFTHGRACRRLCRAAGGKCRWTGRGPRPLPPSGPRAPEVPRATGSRRCDTQKRDGQGTQARSALTPCLTGLDGRPRPVHRSSWPRPITEASIPSASAG